MLLAGLISHNSLQLLIRFCLSHFPNLLDMLFSFVLYFLRVLNLEANFLLCSEAFSGFPRVMLRIRLSFII